MGRKNTKVVLIFACVLGLAAAGAIFTSHVEGALGTARAAKVVTAPVAEVDVAAAIGKDIVDWQSYSGRLQAVDYVEIRALVPGTIMAVYFKDGAMVKKGDSLFLIDPRPYAAALDQAAAQHAASVAHANFAATDYARAQRLIATNAIAKRDFDEKANLASEAAANVKATDAAVARARLDLGYTRIVAPVSGRMSRTAFTTGNVIGAGVASAPLATLVSVSPVYADFDVDEQTYLSFLGRRSREAIPVRLGLANETGYSRQGQIASIENRLNAKTGTIGVRATFKNEDGALLPGLFARVAVDGGGTHPAVLVDERAISTDQAKKFVLVVDDKNRAQYREIKLGSMFDGYRVVSEGLKRGERIVVSGTQRVHPGGEIKPTDVPMSGEKTLVAS